MEQKVLANNLDFLAGGGEMGALIRSKDWTQTSLGAPDNWPQSLRTTLSILLNSGFPMFLFWGPDLLCFYNDAFRPSLGQQGKHPMMLGMKGEQAWSEIWTTIQPWIDEVINQNKAIWNEDMALPIFRNGGIEEVFWTFSYSPVKDESGRTAGVFVAVIETTEQIHSQRKIADSELRFRTLADNIPNLAWMADAEGWIYWYNKKWYEFTGTTPEQMEGWGWQEVHDPLRLPKVLIEWRNSIATGAPFEMIFPLKSADGHYRQFLTRVLPVRDQTGQISQWFGTNTDITRQIETENALKESEERFRTMAEASEILIAQSDATGSVIYFNDAWVKLTGKPLGALLNFGWTDLVPAEDRERYMASYQASFAAQEPYSGEFRLRNKNNSFSWLFAQGTPLYRPDGSFSGYISSCINVTEQKASLEKIEQSEKDLRSLVIHAPVGICVINADTMLNEIVNESFISLSGKSYEAIAGKNYEESFPELSEVHNDALATVMEKGESYFANDVKLMINRNGNAETAWVNFVYTPLKDKQGLVKKVAVWMLENTRQVIERRRVEELVAARTRELQQLNETLKQSEERYHLMVEEVQDYAILYLNEEGIVENWNLGAEKIKGYTANEIIGKSFSQFYTEADRANNLPSVLLNRARQEGRATQQGWRVRKNGSWFWASVVITAVHNEQGQVIGFSKVTHDLTEKKLTEDQLKLNAAELEQKNADLEKMNKELQAFAYVSSHDLQEPLRKIQTFSSQIQEREAENLSESGKDKFRRMQKAAERMRDLIQDLLAYSRTNTGEGKFETINLHEILDDIKEDLKEEIEKKQAIIEANDLGKLRIIPFQFRQLLFNLISNSLKFSKEDQPVKISINRSPSKAKQLNGASTANTGNYCKLSVTDNGIGFEQQYSEKIFEVFQRLHGKHTYEGTGIGLAIVKKIVENHGGTISVKSQPGEGTTFDIIMPVEN